MHRSDQFPFRHSYDFAHDFSRVERRIRVVIGITVAMMVLEITAGILSHSMVVLGEGWHMSTPSPATLVTSFCFR